MPEVHMCLQMLELEDNMKIRLISLVLKQVAPL
jgi:hypothetical protein